MNSAQSLSNDSPGRGRGALISAGAALFFVSAAVLLLQLNLMRALSVIRYHHFSYLVISTALLGFGAGGTFLSLLYGRIRRRFERCTDIFISLFTISIPIAYISIRLLPIDVRYLFFSISQGLLLLLYNLIIFIPFFFGAVVIAMILTRYSRHISLLYGINLFASGLGGIGALGLMFLLPAERLPLTVTLLGLAALLCRLPGILRRYRPSGRLYRPSGGAADDKSAPGPADSDRNPPGPAGHKKSSRLASLLFLAAIAAAALALLLPVPGTIDRYKALSYLRHLEAQGDAEHVAVRHSPRMRLDIYDAPSLHHTLFVSPGNESMPPPQMAVLADGEMGGTIFKAESLEETEVMKATPQSLPYRLLEMRLSSGAAIGRGSGAPGSRGPDSAGPRVLLLGETGGSNIWLAGHYSPVRITVAQENEALLELLRGPLREESGGIFTGETFTESRLQIEEQVPRLFLETSGERYDLIHFASSEGMPAGTGGLNSLHENHLLTVEAVSRTYELLEENGFIAVTRGIQTPPRDNVKILSLFAAALREKGLDPSRHILQGRNYLAVTTLLYKGPIPEDTVANFLGACEELEMDPEYYPGITAGAAEPTNRVQGPEGESYSYYFHAAQKILNGSEAERRSFYRTWAYNVNAPTDDSPYFHNFFKWGSLGSFLDAYGASFFRKMELGYLILVLTLAEVTIIAFVLILLPLFAGGRSGGENSVGKKGERMGRAPLAVFLHFAAIGFGFMFIEMVFIQKLSNFLGDPIYSASAVITAILVFAGIASSLQKRIPFTSAARIRIAGTAVALCLLLSIFFIDSLLEMFIDRAPAVRYLFSMLLLLPVSFFMGWMLPSGVERINVSEPSPGKVIPWAWGVNGFTSVAAGPLAILLSIHLGFSGLLTAAALCYLTAAAATLMWKDSSSR